jgi:hypothetical protein
VVLTVSAGVSIGLSVSGVELSAMQKVDVIVHRVLDSWRV